MLTYNAYFRCI